MKTMILIPCMDMVHTAFMRSLLLLNTAGHDITYGIHKGSLVYDSRNQLLASAKDVDRILWVDSDMDLPMNTIQQLSADIDEGRDIVCGLCFKRKPPFSPVIYKKCCLEHEGTSLVPVADPYLDYPKNEVFEVEACGFGCVMMTKKAADKIVDSLGAMPFMPTAGFGEDLSFCMRARHIGIRLWCDPRVKVGHVGQYTFTEEDYGRFNAGNQG